MTTISPRRPALLANLATRMKPWNNIDFPHRSHGWPGTRRRTSFQRRSQPDQRSLFPSILAVPGQSAIWEPV